MAEITIMTGVTVTETWLPFAFGGWWRELQIPFDFAQGRLSAALWMTKWKAVTLIRGR
jgi:hypothetical protein